MIHDRLRDRSRMVEWLFHRATELKGQDRLRFLIDEATDADMRAEVEELLRCDHVAEDLLDKRADAES